MYQYVYQKKVNEKCYTNLMRILTLTLTVQTHEGILFDFYVCFVLPLKNTSFGKENFDPSTWRTSRTTSRLIYLKTFHKSTFLGPVTSILTFFQFSEKCARLYRPFRSFRLL